jgi:hypothetical protein
VTIYSLLARKKRNTHFLVLILCSNKDVRNKERKAVCECACASGERRLDAMRKSGEEKVYRRRVFSKKPASLLAGKVVRVLRERLALRSFSYTQYIAMTRNSVVTELQVINVCGILCARALARN